MYGRIIKLTTALLFVGWMNVNSYEYVGNVAPPISLEEIRYTDLGVSTIVDEIEGVLQFWKFEVSYYCSCYKCTQNIADVGRTASGKYAEEGVTIATPSDIPFDSLVVIENVGSFEVQDRGGYIQYSTDSEGLPVMRVDIYVDSHSRALEYGRHYSNGYIEIMEG